MALAFAILILSSSHGWGVRTNRLGTSVDCVAKKGPNQANDAEPTGPAVPVAPAAGEGENQVATESREYQAPPAEGAGDEDAALAMKTRRDRGRREAGAGSLAEVGEAKAAAVEVAEDPRDTTAAEAPKEGDASQKKSRGKGKGTGKKGAGKKGAAAGENPQKVTKYSQEELLSIARLPASKIKKDDLSPLIDSTNKESELLMHVADGKGGGKEKRGGTTPREKALAQKVPQAASAAAAEEEAVPAAAKKSKRPKKKAAPPPPAAVKPVEDPAAEKEANQQPCVDTVAELLERLDGVILASRLLKEVDSWRPAEHAACKREVDEAGGIKKFIAKYPDRFIWKRMGGPGTEAVELVEAETKTA